MSTSKTYDLRVITEFSSAHVLRGYPGACERVHGHNFRVEVVVRATALDELGMGLDFRELTAMTEALTAGLDHRLLNEVPPFDEVNPTAENSRPTSIGAGAATGGAARCRSAEHAGGDGARERLDLGVLSRARYGGELTGPRPPRTSPGRGRHGHPSPSSGVHSQ